MQRMNYTPEKIDKLHTTYVRKYRSVYWSQSSPDRMTDLLGRDDFFKRYLEEREKRGSTLNIIQAIVYSQIKK